MKNKNEHLKHLSEFDIQFIGLKNGSYTYNYIINEHFFSCFEQSPIKNGNVPVCLKFVKQNNNFELNFEISGEIEVTCDLCLETFNTPIKSDSNYFVKFKEGILEPDFEDIDTIYIPFDSTQINVSQLIYELIVLCLPLHPLHKDDENGNSTCNPEMLAIIKKYSPQQFEDDTLYIDPRWQALKNLN